MTEQYLLKYNGCYQCLQWTVQITMYDASNAIILIHAMHTVHPFCQLSNKEGYNEPTQKYKYVDGILLIVDL